MRTPNLNLAFLWNFFITYFIFTVGFDDVAVVVDGVVVVAAVVAVVAAVVAAVVVDVVADVDANCVADSAWHSNYFA